MLDIAVNEVTNLELILLSEGHTTLSVSQLLLNFVRHKIILTVSFCGGYISEKSTATADIDEELSSAHLYSHGL